MKHKIVYYFPLEIYLMEKKIEDIKEMTIKLLYSILTVNANLNNEIIVYTDFKGMSMLSILPLNFKIIHANTVGNFYDNVIKDLNNEKYIILTENHILKMCTNFKGEYINGFQINDNAIVKNIITNDILIKVKEISKVLYDKFTNNVRKYLV